MAPLIVLWTFLHGQFGSQSSRDGIGSCGHTGQRD